MSHQIIKFKTLNFDQISEALSSRSSLKKSSIVQILEGFTNPALIQNYEQYSSIFKLRHDLIHWLICDYRELPFGERKISSFNWDEKVTGHKYYHLVSEQTPDIVVINGRTVQISELTISRMKKADIPKITKYRLLVDIIKQAGYDVNLEVILINAAFSIPDQVFLQTEYKFPVELIDSIYKVIDNIDRILHIVNESPMGAEWSARFRGLILEKVEFDYTDQDVVDFYETKEAKPFNSTEDLRSILEHKGHMDITDDENKFIDLLVQESIKINPSLAKHSDPRGKVQEVKEYHENNKKGYLTDDIRSFMPLPFFEHSFIDSARRSTLEDIQSTDRLKSLLRESDDSFLSQLSKLKDDIGVLKLPEDVKYKIALSGPGRRKYVMSGSPEHIKRQTRWDKHWIPTHQHFNDHIEDISYQLSRIYGIDDDLLVKGPGMDYIKCCQSIFREININALRRERRRSYVLKPTGVAGVFVVIFPGPKLRTGEKLSKIWFKLIFDKELFSFENPLTRSWCFKKMYQDKQVLHSDWLSTDANRLDHYIRCYDKVLMAYACYNSMTDLSIKTSMMRADNNTLGIIIMIYMENKRSTSKMLQDVRYLIMTALSMYNYYSDVLDKFKDPIRTPLQSYLLTKILEYPLSPEVRMNVLSSDFGKVNVESGTGEPFDRYAGSIINMPRILTNGPVITFKQMLCEMYFTMLFNKNQDDPTHASFQILSKILEGERSLSEVKNGSVLHTGLKDDPFTDALTLINNPHRNQFSRTAIVIASKLQAKSVFNKANSGVAHTLASQSIYINKTIDEFATFKSSSIYERDYLNMKVYENRDDLDKKKDAATDKKKKVSEERNVQNRRRRCLEGVLELAEDDCIRSFDVVKKHLMSPIHFQVFKKNQIGGVREILILDIQKRITINVLESFSRVICTDDDREMLTHGDKKNTLIRDLIRQLKRGTEKKLIMNYNFDKTKWAPSFMPIQFAYMFLPFKDKYPSLFRFILISLINHTNKEFILPERLILAWRNDLSNELQHLMDPDLQKLKEAFLATKKLSYLNESNMGQGILHYTSSLYHLCVVSLRDEVYKRLCKLKNISTGEWRDMVSSDDSYTAHAMPMDSKFKVKLRINLFLRAQEIVERVMNVWTSKSKSSISLLIYEFNSLFGSNMTMHPTTFKFALASVHPVSTDSFFKMVKESYISCRQIVENGGSLELYALASKLNKDYCESIYHTHSNGYNDLSPLGVRREYTPYQMGIYPIDDPALMIMFGPEVQNYRILLNEDNLNHLERRLFRSTHTLVKTNDPEVITSIGTLDNVLVGVNRIEAKTGLIKKLERIKQNCSMNWEYMQSYIEDNPLILFNPPKDQNELQIKIMMRLYKNGAAEAMRTTAASIYYGRVAATVSAKAFHIPFTEQNEPMTYLDCFHRLIQLDGAEIDLKLLYPHFEEFKEINTISTASFMYSIRNPLETQNIRHLQLNRIHQRLNNPITTILNAYWGDKKDIIPNSILRDWINLTDMVPIIRNTIEETMDAFPGDRSQKLKTLMLVILRLMSQGSKPMKAIIYGTSSRSSDRTYLILKQNNLYHNVTSNELAKINYGRVITQSTDLLSFYYNLFILSQYLHCDDQINLLTRKINDVDITSFLLDNSLNPSSYKKILLMLMYFGRIENVTNWSEKTHTIFHQWVVRSKGGDGFYSGDYIFKIQMGHTIMQIQFIEKKDLIFISINRVDRPQEIKDLLDKSLELCSMTEGDFFRKVEIGNYIKTSDIVMPLLSSHGFKMYVKQLTPITFSPGNFKIDNGFITLYDRDGYVIMKTVEGLLHTDYKADPTEIHSNMTIHGLPLLNLINMGIFTSTFSLEHFSSKDLVDLLNHKGIPTMTDLDVPKPNVSRITNSRLNINFPERGQEYDLAEVMLSTESAPMIEKIDDDDSDDIYATLFDVKIDENIMDDFIGKNDEVHELWFDPDYDINLMKTMSRQIITYQPKQILERVLRIKYQIITSLVSTINILNKNVIKAAKRLTGNNSIVYSLIYTYDRQFTNTDVKSPHGCEFSIDPYFDKIYGIGDLNDESIEM
jgi:hypothetical protein